MSEQNDQQRQPWQWADAKIAGFVGPATTRNGKGVLYQFSMVVSLPTGNKNVVHDHLIAYEGRVNEKSVESLAALFPTWNKSLLYSDNPAAALEDLDRIGKEMGSRDGAPMPDNARIPVRVAYELRPWTTKNGEPRTAFETKRIQLSGRRSNTKREDIMAAFGKAPPPPARAARPAPAPKAVVYPPNADGGWNAYCAAGQPADAFWPRVLEFANVDNPDKITADGWRTFIESLTAERSATPPPAPVVPNPIAKDDADSQLPF